MQDFLDRFPFAPLYSLIGVVTVCAAFLLDSISVQEFGILFAAVTGGPGLYALGRNVGSGKPNRRG